MTWDHDIDDELAARGDEERSRRKVEDAPLETGGVLAYGCPACGAQPGFSCTSDRLKVVNTVPHEARWDVLQDVMIDLREERGRDYNDDHRLD